MSGLAYLTFTMFPFDRQLPGKDLDVEQKLSMDRTVSRPLSEFERLIPLFADYARYDLRLAEATITKYRDCLSFILRDLPHIKSPTDITLTDITLLKKKTFERGANETRVNSMIFALRKFLQYCRSYHGLGTINEKDIKPMKIPFRQKQCLTAAEMRQFLDGINGKTLPGARMKALAVVLCTSGMRISEALSLDWQKIDWNLKEANIIGKGNKERTVYFDDEALGWLRAYKLKREDNNPAVFVTLRAVPKRLRPFDLSKIFKHYAAIAGIKKKVTPHTLRRSMASVCAENGMKMEQLQQILGHSSILTTAKHYVIVNKQAVKESLNKFLKF